MNWMLFLGCVVLGVLVLVGPALVFAWRERALRAHLAEMDQVRQRAVKYANERGQRSEDLWASLVRMEKERDQWRDLYQTHALEHGNAQALLLNECTRMAQICQLAKLDIQVSPAVRSVVLEYHEAHVAPQLKRDPELKHIPIKEPESV